MEASTPKRSPLPIDHQERVLTNGEALKQPPKQDILVVKKRDDPFHRELTETVHRNDLQSLKRAHKNDDVFIGEKSTAEQVQAWLEHKEFSVRTMRLLTNQTGATLFSLTKPQLQNFCGKEEGQRLYSFLLVQKGLSGYRSTTARELKAVLAMRKKQTDDSNSTDTVVAAVNV